MRNIIFDGDPGHDDAIAFLTALANRDQFNILGFTTVCGNQSVDKCTKNALKLMDLVGIHVPVAQGYATPLIRPFDSAAKYHGETGLDGLAAYPDPVSQPLRMHAVDFLRQTIENCPDKVTLVTMGPFTNIAMLLKTYPHLKDKIEEIVSMAGSYNSGNTLAKAEFNVYCDPESAKIVFDSGVRIVLATIEACFAGGVLLTEQEKFKEGGKVSKIVYDILKFYSRYAIKNGWDRTAIFDLTTVIYLLAPEIFEYEDMTVHIECGGTYTRGMTVCDNRGPLYNTSDKIDTRVLLGCDREQLVKILFDSIARLDQQVG